MFVEPKLDRIVAGRAPICPELATGTSLATQHPEALTVSSGRSYAV